MGLASYEFKEKDTTFLLERSSISPIDELVAYEYLWSKKNSTLKNISDILSKTDKLPSDLLKDDVELFNNNLETVKEFIYNKIKENPNFSIMLKESPQFPDSLLKAKHPIDLFYYRGNPDLVQEKCISIVGAREVSQDGIRRTQKLVKMLAEKKFTIVSGLAKGVDTVALTSAIEHKRNVIGVIGTPIDEYYPKENRKLQEKIARKHLLISQVPFYKYSVQPFNTKRIYFVERNVTMAALSVATIIVEASDTSGSLTQARACMEQGSTLFILNSCFENPNIKWPGTYEKKGAIRVRNLDDILSRLPTD
jgi:DNA processing protein